MQPLNNMEQFHSFCFYYNVGWALAQQRLRKGKICVEPRLIAVWQRKKIPSPPRLARGRGDKIFSLPDGYGPRPNLILINTRAALNPFKDFLQMFCRKNLHFTALFWCIGKGNNGPFKSVFCCFAQALLPALHRPYFPC